jgi:ATP-dependent protease ClpP protease subunit
MAVVIDLQGEIGWEIRPQSVAKKLARTKGEDIIVRLSTIGGDVFDGADIVNMFMDHRRDNPGIEMHLEVKAIAASYGSALMSAGIWDSIGISRVTAFMMHNTRTFTFGDSQELESTIAFLTGLDTAYRALYSDQSGKSIAEVTNLMNVETWFFGQEIIDEGFADKIITMEDEGGDPLPLLDDDTDNRNIFIVDFKNQREALMEKQKEKAKDEKFDVKRAVACLRIKDGKQTMVIPGEKPETNKPVETGKSKTEVPKVENKAELKKELPGVYDEVLNDGVMSERAENKERMSKLVEMKTSEDYKDIPEAVAVIEVSMVDGSSIQSTETKITAAMVKLLKKPGKIDEIESPEDLTGGDPVKPTMKTEKQREV